MDRTLRCRLAAVVLLATGATALAAAPAERASPPAPELKVEPWRTFGTGKAEAAPQAVNPPDGVAFTSDGLLLATDARNHRVQIFDPIRGRHLGSFGDAKRFVGDVVSIAEAPDRSVVVSDEIANRANVFLRRDNGYPRYVSADRTLFGGQDWKRLTAIAFDSAGRFYAIDSLAGEVRRYLPDMMPDPKWNFERLRPDGGPMLNRADGIAIHEASGTVFVSSERDGVVRAFDLNTGRWLGKAIGRRCDPASGKPTGESVFSRSVEGLAVLGDYLLAVDEGFDDCNAADDANMPGRLFVFQLDDPAVSETDAESCRRRMAAGKPAGLVGWLGRFSSPDGVAVFVGSPDRKEALVAVADQGHYRVEVYRVDDILRAIQSVAPRGK